MALSRLLPRPNTRTKTTKESTVTQVIAFANQKGGVAKTTTTLNLGVAFQERGFRVLLAEVLHVLPCHDRVRHEPESMSRAIAPN